MSIRRFLVLVRGLGPNSATLIRHVTRDYIGTGRGRAERIVESASPQDSENALAAMFGIRPVKVH